jgi:uncharacterized protein
MPTIHDLIRAIAQRDGIEAVVVLGRDGLLIDARTSERLDGEQLAAIAPVVATAADSLGAAASTGAMVTGVLEFEGGMAVVSSLSADALLLVVVHASADVGSLMHDLRRHRANIASLV